MKGFGKTIGLIFFAGILLATFGTGFFFGKTQAVQIPVEGLTNLETAKPTDVNFTLFWDAWRKIQEKSAQSGNLNSQTMVYGAIEGMVNSLKDPYTVFFNPEDTKKFLEDVKGSFEGVGMEIGIKEDQLQVVSPIEGTPAQKAGLRSGDFILQIDETSSSGLALEEAVSKIRGPKGTTVKLSIYRKGWDKAKDFSIQREVIQVPSLKWEMKEQQIAYLHIYQFSEKAGQDFGKAVNEMQRAGAQKMVLDLRGNPGGYLEVAQDIAGWFLKRGQVVVIEDFVAANKKEEYKAQGNEDLVAMPVVILIDEGSASASEILAGALKDNRGIKLVGKKSFGKGSVQELESLKDGSSLKITVANWLTPSGTLLSKKGLDPDILVEITEEDREAGKDPQLEKAIEILKQM
ncbi:MAG: S41 family peptidase [bacterium]|nr:S41 family peptidase [bacterium]